MASFKANGKFLLTGEYLVLHGALSLALPLKLGQTMNVETANNDIVRWTAKHPLGLWFEASFDRNNLDLIESSDVVKAGFVAHLLEIVKKGNHHLFDKGLVIDTKLDFDPQWGMGSSSTLVNNIARWAGMNPYQILKDTFGGSGYDIACAEASSPIFYLLENDNPIVQKADFNPPFAQHLYFVYQGKKQSSAMEVKSFMLKDGREYLKYIPSIDAITKEMVKVDKLEDFCRLLDEHETCMSECLGKPKLKTFFSDFEGSLKSLGAWGGDFMLAATDKGEEYVKKYFAKHDMDVVLRYDDIVLFQNGNL